MVARNQLYSDGGDLGPGIEGLTGLELWKRNYRREVARRRNVPRSHVHVEVRREHGEIVLDATVME